MGIAVGVAIGSPVGGFLGYTVACGHGGIESGLIGCFAGGVCGAAAGQAPHALSQAPIDEE